MQCVCFFIHKIDFVRFSNVSISLFPQIICFFDNAHFYGIFKILIDNFADFYHKMYDFVQICLKLLIFSDFASLYAPKLYEKL